VSWIVRFKKWLFHKLKYYSGVASLIVYSIPEYIFHPEGRPIVNSVLIMQIYFTANLALKIISLVAIALGGVTVLQLFTQLSKLGALDFVGKILNIVIIRELGPLITAFIVISRSGSAIAAEIATMNINDETNALEMIGIDTMKMIVFPRVIGMVISMVLLITYFDAVGIFGGFLVGTISSRITFDMFMRYVMNSITIPDVLSGLIKGVLFGFFIAAISIYHGFQASIPTQVPQATTKAVVNSIVAVVLVDVIVTLMFYM